MTITPTASPEMPDLDKLEALARAATPGPWHNQSITDDECQTVGLSVHAEAAKYPLIDEDHMPGMKDAEFIATANPAAVLALIATARRNERMFMAACADLGLVNEALDLDPDDGGADPILDAIEELKQARHTHPEGEAPQADCGECEHCHTERPLHLLTCPVSVKAMAEGKKKEAPEPLRQLLIDFSNNTYFCGLHLNDDAKYAGYFKDAEVAEQAIIELFGSKASPLCGAQHADVPQLVKERDGWKEESEHQKACYERACESVEMLRDHERKHFWVWQGDGSDNLASMSRSMTILIRAEQLRVLAAQHAESGKEADAAEKAAAYDELNRIAELHGFASAAAAIAAARRAVQQVEASDPLDVLLDRVTQQKRVYLEESGYIVVGYVMQNSVNELCTLAHGRVEWLGKGTVTDYGTSAPGTPEAPNWAAPDACGQCNGRGTYTWQGGENECVYCMGTGKQSQRAAQFDGGQEGSESNG